MIPDTEVMARLERLERDNRRLKRLVSVALVLAAAFGTIYATRPVPNAINAHRFNLLDDAGRVRATLGLNVIDHGAKVWGFKPKNSVGLVLYDVSGDVVGELKGDNDGSDMGLWDPHSQTMAMVDAVHVFSLSGEKLARSNYEIPDIELSGPLGGLGAATININEQGSPTIRLADAQGFSMALGSTATTTLVTGETQQTSADSIVMFGNDKKHHVIWQAP